MGVDVRAVLKEPDVTKVIEYLCAHPATDNFKILPTGMANFWWVLFDWNSESRNMSVFFNGECKGDYETVWPHVGVLCSLGCWGMSDAILTMLAKKFGGFVNYNDTEDKWVSFDP